MKFRFTAILCVIVGAAILSGCSNEYAFNEWSANGEQPQDFTAIVSVHRSPADTVYFQVDDTTRLFPVNYQLSYDGPERIVCGITVTRKTVGSYGYYTVVNWSDQLDKGTFTPTPPSGEGDGVDIISDWMTSCEDGFLTLHYSAWWGSGAVRHSLTLVSGLNPSDPYELHLIHDSMGDTREKQNEALVYFDINSLPDTGDDYKTLTLKWTDSGGKTAEKEFRFKTRTP